MPIFTYEARNLQGTIIKNKMEANSKEEVILNLRQRDYFPITIHEEGTGLNKEINIGFLDKIKLKDLSLFARQFAFIIQSGTPMLRALELSMEQMENKKLKEILKRTNSQVQKGRALSEAFKYEDDIPPLMVNMIEAGEMSGRLEHIMNELSEYYRKQHKQNQKVSSAMMYPKIVITFSVIVVLFMMTFVVPEFVNSLGEMGGTLPLPTKVIMGISNLLKDYMLIWLAIVGAVVGFKFLVLEKDPNYQIKKGKKKLSGKLFGQVNSQLAAARFASTFSILLSSGLSIINALDIAGKVLENKYLEQKIELAKEDIKKGNAIGKTLEDLNVFPLMLTQMIIVGEETGQLEEIMKKTAEFYDGEAEVAIEKMITLIEPLLIMGLAIVVFFIVLSLLLPMFSMMDAIS